MTLQLSKPIVYATRDIERALGIEPAGNYFVISNDSKYGREIQIKHPNNIRLIADARGPIDTYDLLLSPEVQKTISDRGASLIVFQNTPRIERLAKEKGWNLLNPSASLAKEVEEKISQMRWLGEDARLLPPSKIARVKDVEFEGKKFVLQFNHSHTGQGTFIIDDAAKLAELQAKFPDRDARVSDFIDGPVFTVNAVAADEILVGNPSYQITGLRPFTDLPFSTIGNDFSLPHDAKYKRMYEETRDIASRIGSKLKEAGWKGLFGIDVIYEEASGKTYLLEINARQPASAVFESKLQKETDPNGLSIFEAHISSLIASPISQGLVSISSGAQIVKRATKNISKVDVAKLRAKGFEVIEYENDLHNKELFRMQSGKGIMEAHGRLNDVGNLIKSCLL